MRFELAYRSNFEYSELVSESQNELRACPTTDECQRLLECRVTVNPSARIHSYVDAWGTRVDAFGIRKAHLAMEVLVEASVETSPRPLPTAAPRMESLTVPEFVDSHCEYLQRDRHTDGGPLVCEAAERQLDLAGPDVVGVVLAIHRFVSMSMTYTPASTEVGIHVEEVLRGGVGVCQDYAHLAVAMCRCLGVPARYVSGYLFTDRDDSGADTTADRVVVQTHAWMEAAIPGWGWLALDPTNGQLVGERHIKIGHGRSYDDVQPLRGVYLGPASSEVDASVEIRRVIAEPRRQPHAPLDAGPHLAGVRQRAHSDHLPLGAPVLRQQAAQQQQ